jgi:hypothetical protein
LSKTSLIRSKLMLGIGVMMSGGVSA